VSSENRCPVCGARFRGAHICSRCGADLEPLMLLAAAAWRLREASRRAVDDGNAERAFAFASRAEQLHRTRAGEDLIVLSGRMLGDAQSSLAIEGV